MANGKKSPSFYSRHFAINSNTMFKNLNKKAGIHKDSVVLLLLLTLNSTSAQVNQSKAVIKNKAGNQSKIIERGLIDTLTANKRDTISVPKNQITDRQLRIVFEEKNNTDYFKYIFPILTLLLGIGINKVLDYLKDSKRVKKSGERWQAELMNLETSISQQMKYLDDFLTEHNKEVFSVPELNVAVALECEAFNSLDKGEFIKFIQDNLSKNHTESIQLSGKINSTISIIKGNNESLKLKFNKYLQDSSAYTTKFSFEFQELLREFANYGVQLEKEMGTDPINNQSYKSMANLFSNEVMPKIQSGDYDIFELEKNFFLPLLIIIGKLRLDERTRKMAIVASECMNNIKAIKMERRYLSENISAIISRYKNDAKNLNKLLVELNN